MTDLGQKAAAMLAEVARISEPGPGVTRFPFTGEHRRAAALVEGWMRAAGLDTRTDAAGTLIGRRAGARPDAPVFLMGSHQDSVRNGGAFDGIMGVVLPILAVGALGDRRLPYTIEVLCFADEEGARFPTALMGPRALAGTFDPAVLEMTDTGGTSLRDAMAGFGLDPDAVAGLARDPAGVLGYLETHIEQGPVLEAEDLPVGIVTAIAGIERHAVEITGRSAHAGTTPMELRHDALAVAAELVLDVERRAREADALVGTVGALNVTPNVVNAVPGGVRMTAELRSSDDALREAAGRAVTERARKAAAARGCGIEMARTYSQRAQACDAALRDHLEAAVAAAGVTPRRLMSGATHDASAMADLTRMAMLFVRCREGVSHHPDEWAGAADMGVAVDVLRRFLLSLAQEDR